MQKIVISGLVALAFLAPSVSFAATTTPPLTQAQYIADLQLLLSLLEQELALLQSQQTTMPDESQQPVESTSVTSPATNQVTTPATGSVSAPAITVTIDYQNHGSDQYQASAQDGGTYSVGMNLLFVPMINGVGEHQLVNMEFSTTNPDGFKYPGNGPVTDATFQMWSDGLSGPIVGILKTPGTYTYTLTLPDYNVSKTITVTVQ